MAVVTGGCVWVLERREIQHYGCVAKSEFVLGCLEDDGSTNDGRQLGLQDGDRQDRNDRALPLDTGLEIHEMLRKMPDGPILDSLARYFVAEVDWSVPKMLSERLRDSQEPIADQYYSAQDGSAGPHSMVLGGIPAMVVDQEIIVAGD